MSKLKDLINSIKNEINHYDDYIKRINNINSTIPAIQQKKEEAQAKLEMVEALPEDIAEELSPRLITYQQQSEDYIFPLLSRVPEIDPIQSSTDFYSAGSSTAYVHAINMIIESQPNDENNAKWIDEVNGVIDNFAGEIAKRDLLPKLLDKLHPSLGEMFNKAITSIDRCKAGALEVNLGAMQLREVLNQIWGNVVDLARDKDTTNQFNTSNLQMKKKGDRNIVVELLINDEYKKLKLSDSLELLFRLFSQLSETNFGKNPLSSDLKRLILIYDQWLLVIDDITSIVCS